MALTQIRCCKPAFLYLITTRFVANGQRVVVRRPISPNFTEALLSLRLTDSRVERHDSPSHISPFHIRHHRPQTIFFLHCQLFVLQLYTPGSIYLFDHTSSKEGGGGGGGGGEGEKERPISDNLSCSALPLHPPPRSCWANAFAIVTIIIVLTAAPVPAMRHLPPTCYALAPRSPRNPRSSTQPLLTTLACHR